MRLGGVEKKYCVEKWSGTRSVPFEYIALSNPRSHREIQDENDDMYAERGKNVLLLAIS